MTRLSHVDGESCALRLDTTLLAKSIEPLTTVCAPAGYAPWNIFGVNSAFSGLSHVQQALCWLAVGCEILRHSLSRLSQQISLAISCRTGRALNIV